MKYIINEHQYKLLTEQEEEILRVPFAAFGNDWDSLQNYLERRGNPPYEITDDLDLYRSEIKSLGNLTSVGGSLNLNIANIKSLGNLTSVGGDLNLRYSEIESLGNLTSVGGNLYLWNSKIESFGNLTSFEEILSMVKVGGTVYL